MSQALQDYKIRKLSKTIAKYLLEQYSIAPKGNQGDSFVGIDREELEQAIFNSIATESF